MGVEVIPGELDPFSIAIAILSGFIVIFGFVSMFVKERLFISEAFVALVVGIIAGPIAADGFDPYEWGDTDMFTKQITRCIIAIQVMAVGIELPKHYMKKEWRTMFMLLLPVMLFMWLISGLFIWAFIPPLNYLHSLVIAACVCPTDPILANSVVKGRFAEKHVPAHIRNALSAESGANDGLGFPFLFLAIFLIGEPGTGHAIGKWIYETCLFQIALSCVIGIVVGYVARKILQWSERNHLIDKPSFLSFGIALALFLMAMTGFSGSDDLLACFAAGNAFSWDDWFREETEEAHFQEVIDMMLNLAVFAYIGAIIPWHEFGNAEIGLSPWRLIVIAILILLFRRLPIVIALKPVMPALKTYREAVFSGWFGPMGVGAVFLSTIAKEELEAIYEGQAEKPLTIELVSPIVLFIVLASTLVHGTTIPLFQLGKRIRTRTLSITSTGSTHRLPKLAQSLSLRRNHDEQDLGDGTWSQTQRNTLINTIQRKKEEEEEAGKHANGLSQDHKAIEIDDGAAEEDFLPDDSDDKLALPPSRGTEERNSSAQIQFLEPVKPKPTSQANLNVEKNEASVSSFSSFRGMGNHESSSSSGGGGNALLNLFRRKDHTQQQENNKAPQETEHLPSPPPPEAVPQSEKAAEQVADEPNATEEETVAAEEAYHRRGLHPRIQVWEENSHIVIEDTADVGPQSVLTKRDPEWRQKTKEKVKELEAIIKDQEQK